MTKLMCSKVVVPMALALSAGFAFAADLDETGQGGQYQSSIAAVRVKGTTGDFAPSLVYAPFILLNKPGTAPTGQLFLNGTAAEVTRGGPIAAVSTFAAGGRDDLTAPKVVALLGTVDGSPRLPTGTSVNTIVNEGTSNLSNSLGALLPDGTIGFYERFENFSGRAHNNLGYFNDVDSLGTVPTIGGAFKSISAAYPNIGNATETAINGNTATVTGSIFLGSPSYMRDPNRSAVNDGNLLTGYVTFNGNTTLTAAQSASSTNGVVVLDGRDNAPSTVLGPSVTANCVTGVVYPYTPAMSGTYAYWLQASVPLPTNPAGECRTDARQSKPVLQSVTTPGGRTLVYALHGIGFSGGTPFTGGSANPVLLAVDTVDAPAGGGRLDYAGSNAVASFNTILIEADAAGGEGSQHGRPYDSVAPLSAGFADHFTTNPDQYFLESQATGGGNGPSTNPNYDMNASGTIVALWVNELASPRAHEIRVYEPIWDTVNDRIAGYSLDKIVTFNGDLDNGGATLIVSNLLNTVDIDTGPAVDLQEVVVPPFSGTSIDNAGRVAFVGVTEQFTTTGDWDANPFSPETIYLQNTTNSLFVYEPTTDSLHKIVSGGQSGDVLTDAFPASGPATNDSLALGFFPVSPADSSDAFSSASFSRTGGVLALNFRNGGNQTVNGVNTELETQPDGTPDLFNDNGGVLVTGAGASLTERSVRGTVVVQLGEFITAPVCCLGDADASGSINFDDITAVLGNFGTSGTPGQNGNGDADCNGSVNFDDVTTVLGNFGTNCN
jgi:hypothetical protein